MNSIDIFGNPAIYPSVIVSQHALARAILQLGKIEALALIRAAYQEEDGNIATLNNARLIYGAIKCQARGHLWPGGDGTLADEKEER